MYIYKVDFLYSAATNFAKTRYIKNFRYLKMHFMVERGCHPFSQNLGCREFPLSKEARHRKSLLYINKENLEVLQAGIQLKW